MKGGITAARRRKEFQKNRLDMSQTEQQRGRRGGTLKLAWSLKEQPEVTSSQKINHRRAKGHFPTERSPSHTHEGGRGCGEFDQLIPEAIAKRGEAARVVFKVKGR